MLPDSIRVNGVAISSQSIAAESQNHPASNPQDAQKAAIRALVVRELLLQEAYRLDLIPDPVSDSEGRTETDEEALVRQLLDIEINVPKAKEAECYRYYENNRTRFRTSDTYEPKHILIAANESNKDEYATAVAKARQLIEELNEFPNRFDEFAREHSNCKSSENGGVLGKVTHGQTSFEFEKCLRKLDDGQLYPDPIEAPYGVHVLYLIRKHPGQTVPFDLVREKIEEYLKEASWRQAVTQYIEILFGEAKVEGITFQDIANE